MVLDYSRTKYASATDREDGTVKATARVEENFFAAQVELTVSVPELEITAVSGQVERCFVEGCRRGMELLSRVEGLRIGSGLIKLVNGLVGGPAGCPRLADLVLEGCDQVILRFTVGSMRGILAKEGQEQAEAHREFLRQNPRLLNSCVAFAEGSPLREGVETEW